MCVNIQKSLKSRQIKSLREMTKKKSKAKRVREMSHPPILRIMGTLMAPAGARTLSPQNPKERRGSQKRNLANHSLGTCPTPAQPLLRFSLLSVPLGKKF